MHHHQEDRFTTASLNSQPWDADHRKLYAQIKSFAIDSPDALFPFSHRLARDHAWSLSYVHRVIEEYKKFLFLATVAGHPVTPSPAVDEAWHLHLTYTRSYWDDLCTQVLQRSLHHHPTCGGQQQRDLYYDNYRQTLSSYQRFFGFIAPGDIWPSPATRFRRSEQFKQLSSQDYWFIPKPALLLPNGFYGGDCRLLWLRNSTIILLISVLVYGLGMVGRPAVATKVNLSRSMVANPVAAQVSTSSNIKEFAFSTIQPLQGKSVRLSFLSWGQSVLSASIGWLKNVLLLVSLLMGVAFVSLVLALMDSWCPACRRFSYRHVDTHSVREPSEGVDGEAMDVSRCKFCRRVKWRFRRVPHDNSGFTGCAGCSL
jgi:hypothetical protein